MQKKDETLMDAESNLASHTKGGSHFLDTRKKDNWIQQHVYMAEKSIENRF